MYVKFLVLSATKQSSVFCIQQDSVLGGGGGAQHHNSRILVVLILLTTGDVLVIQLVIVLVNSKLGFTDVIDEQSGVLVKANITILSRHVLDCF